MGWTGWLLVALLATGAGLFAWGFWWEPGRLVLNEVDLELPGWPEDEETRVTLIADLHVGSPRNGIDKLRRVVRRVNETLPDLVLIAGDLTIDNVLGGRFVPPEDIATELERINAKYGVFAVIGNHDRWLSAERVTSALEGVGIDVLENANQRVRVRGHDVWIAGVADYWTGHPSVDDALRGVGDDPVLLFTHNPDLFPEVPPEVSLTLAGHTHGGQVLVPFVGAINTPSRFGDRYAEGHIVEDGRHLFVTSGVGTSRIGVRFRVPPEVAALRITRCLDCEPS
ncbi:MAG: metallophosphoesterase [Gemmatimonadetes bacterium]|nr:metallophosphoesterase [Gemmatimonadota bacterium]